MSNEILSLLEQSTADAKPKSTMTLDAATYLSDLIYSYVEPKLNSIDTEESFHIIADFDGHEVTISDEKNIIQVVTTPPIKLFEDVLYDVDVEIKISWDNQGNDIFDVDGWMLTVDDQELEAVGLIYVVAMLPSDLFLTKKCVKSLNQEIKSVLVHELRHSIQRNLWRWVHEEAKDLQTHMKSKSEIDARVEEICSYGNVTPEETSLEEFESLAHKYAKKYLLRNSKDTPLEMFNELCREMVSSHLSYFVKRKKVTELIEPQ